MNGREWREFIVELKQRWGVLWRDRIDDRVRAEGIAGEDYDLLFVDRGTVIVATKDYKPSLRILGRFWSDTQRISSRVGLWLRILRWVVGGSSFGMS